MSRAFNPIEVTDEIAAILDERTSIDEATGCWNWTHRTTSAGYGTLSIRARNFAAHRISYTRHKGPIPEGLVLDHLCRNTVCINPEHLEAVTDQVNILRGMAPGAVATREEACRRGHPRSEYGRQYGPRVHCSACNAINFAAYRARLAS
jgi:hypothetical protein